MATEAQISANRENAKKSTGPRTPEGKAACSRNALVHGMTSGKFLPPGSDPQEYFELQAQFRARFQPFDEVEDTLVERLVAAEFKMRSVRYVDAGIFHYYLKTNPMPPQFTEDSRINPLAWAFQCDSARFNSFTKLIRYEGALQREFSRALRELFLVQDERRARQAETNPQPPACGREQTEPSAHLEIKNAKRTQFPHPAGVPAGGGRPDQPLKPNGKPSSGGS